MSAWLVWCLNETRLSLCNIDHKRFGKIQKKVLKKRFFHIFYQMRQHNNACFWRWQMLLTFFFWRVLLGAAFSCSTMNWASLPCCRHSVQRCKTTFCCFCRLSGVFFFLWKKKFRYLKQEVVSASFLSGLNPQWRRPCQSRVRRLYSAPCLFSTSSSSAHCSPPTVGRSALRRFVTDLLIFVSSARATRPRNSGTLLLRLQWWNISWFCK